MSLLLDPSLREVVNDVCDEIKILITKGELLIEKSERNPEDKSSLKAFSPLMNKIIETANAIDFEDIEMVAKKAKAVSADILKSDNDSLDSLGKGVLFDSLEVMREIVHDTFNEEKKPLSAVIVDRLDWIYVKYNPQANFSGEDLQITPELSKLINK